MDEQIADCIYTGLSTDTGCFRYSNATARTHRIAADMIDCGADAPIITQVMFSIPTAIFTEAFLSFVGLGIPVPQCSLGSLISELYNSFTTHPYQIIPPIVVMSLLMLSFNLLADGLREALDPKMKSM